MTNKTVSSGQQPELWIELYQNAERLSGTGTWQLDLHSRTFLFSENLFHLLEIAPAPDVMVDDFIALVHPSDRKKVEAALKQAETEGLPPVSDFRILRSDGSIRKLKQLCAICQAADGSEYLAGTMQDITRTQTDGNLMHTDGSGNIHKSRFSHILSERKKALEKEDSLLQATLDVNPEMIQVFEAVRGDDGRIVDFRWVLNNKKSERIYGNIIGASLLQRNPGVVTEGIIDSFCRVVETGEPETREIHYRHEEFDGWFLQTAVKLHDGVATNTIDITERKKAAQDLEQSKRLLEHIEDIVALGSWEYDIAQDSFNWSEGMYRLFNIEPGAPLTAAVYTNHATEHSKEHGANITNMLRYGAETFEEVVEIKHDGTPRTLRVKGALMRDERGKPAKMLGVDIDITKELSAEREIHEHVHFIENIAEKSPLLISVIDYKTSKPVFLNRACEEAFGYKLSDDIRIDPELVKSYVHPDDFARVMVHLGELKRLKEDEVKEIEYRVKSHGGNYRWLHQSDTLFKADEEGRPVQVLTMSLDVTQQKKTAKLLSKQESMLRAAERIAHIGSWERNLLTNELMWSDELFRIYGMSPDSVLPSTQVFLEHIVHPEDKEKVSRYVASVYDGHISTTEYRIVQPTGEVRTVYAAPEIIFNEEQKPEILRGISIDITEKKKAEEELMEALNELAMQNQIYGFGEQIVNMGTWTWDPVTDEANFSDNMFRLLGIVPQSLKPSFDTIPNYIHQEDRDMLLDNAALMRQEYKERAGTEFRIVRADGAIRYCRNRSKTIRFGDHDRYIGTMEDITEEVLLRQRLKERTQFAESLSEASIDRILVLDKNLCIEEWNKKCEEAYGLKKEEVTGRKLLEVFPGLAEDEDLTTSVQQALQGAFAWCTNKKGTYASGFYESFFIPLKDESGNTVRILNVIHDITERKQAEELLLRKNEELTLLNKELSSLTSITGHNLKEPLRRVYSFIELALSNPESSFAADARLYLRRAQASVQRMNLLTDDMLSFAHLGNDEKEISEVNLQHLVKYVVHQLQPLVTESQATVYIDSALPNMKGIHSLLSRLLYNLLDNALRYHNANSSAKVWVSAAKLEGDRIDHPAAQHDKGYIQILITDNGIGFEQRHEQVIFQMFQRLVRKEEYGGGTGLGLAVCKRIVEMQQGFITVQSAPGEGATFSVFLPQ